MLRSPPSLLARFAAFISLHWLMNLVSSCKAKKFVGPAKSTIYEISSVSSRLHRFLFEKEVTDVS